VRLGAQVTPAAELQVKLSSDGLSTPVLHSVSLLYEDSPDLAVTDLHVIAPNGTVDPSEVKSGDVITVVATIKNVGSLAAPGSFFTTIYLSSDANITTADSLMGQCTPYGLDVNATYTCTIQYPISIYTSGDPLYVGAITDRNDSIPDSNPLNNTKSTALKITRDKFPDLTVTDLHIVTANGIINPPVVSSGDVITVSATIKNAGTWEVGSTFITAFYLSSNADTSTAGTPMGQCVPYGLAVNDTYTCTIQYAISMYTFGDPLYVGVIADKNNSYPDDSNPGNNKKSMALKIVPDKFADLMVADLRIVAPDGTVNPPELKYGDVITAVATIKNVGSLAAPGSFFTTFYLSNDANITTSDAFMGQCTPYGLDVNATYDCTIHYTITTVADPIYVGVLVDKTNSISDQIRGNNTKSLAVKVTRDKFPDLKVTDLHIVAPNGTVNPPEVKSGDVITVAATITNVGTWEVPSSFITALYLSSDANITTSDAFLGQCIPYGLAVNESSTCTVQYTITTVADPLYLGVIADKNNFYPEDSNPANNKSSIAVRVVP
jgi:hypothetical protein